MGNKISRPRILKRRSNIRSQINVPEDIMSEDEDTIYDANFSWLDGRRVSDELNEAIYLFGRYSEESENLSYLLHIIFKYILRGNVRITLTEMKNCLHIGAGHYIWLTEMANDHKDIQFEGFDVTVSPKEDSATLLPPNVNLRAGNIFNGGLPYPDESFDYVNVRSYLSWLPVDKIPFVLGEIRRVTKRDGWIEFLEMDPFIKNTTPYYEDNLGKIWKDICKHQGYHSSADTLEKLLLNKQEFDEVQNSRLSIPIGKYGGRIGELYAKLFINGSNAVASVIMNKLNMSNEDIQAYLQECLKGLNSKRSFSNMHVVCAKRI